MAASSRRIVDARKRLQYPMDPVFPTRRASDRPLEFLLGVRFVRWRRWCMGRGLYSLTQTPVERRFARLADTANRKAIRLGVPGRLNSIDYLKVFEASWDAEAQDYLCVYCGIGLDPMHSSFDHVDAFGKGGWNTIDNLVACCLTCQRTKHTKNPAELRAWMALEVTCPVDGVKFRPRWADHVRGLGQYCSRRCSGTIGGRTHDA